MVRMTVREDGVRVYRDQAGRIAYLGVTESDGIERLRFNRGWRARLEAGEMDSAFDAMVAANWSPARIAQLSG